MHTFIELPIFTRYAKDYFSDEELAALQRNLSKDSKAGDVVPGSGGVRKLRWSRAGMGKRGGVRALLRAGRQGLYLAFDGVCQECTGEHFCGDAESFTGAG